MFEAALHILLHSEATVEAVAYELPAAWRGLTKGAYFIGFAMVMGTTVVHSLVLRRSLRAVAAERRDAEVLNRRSAAMLAVSGTVFFLSLWPQLAGKAARAGEGMPFSEALLPRNVWNYIVIPGSVGLPLGVMVLIQFSIFAVCSLLLLALVVPRVRGRIDLIAGVAAVGTAIASVLLGLSGDLTGQGVDSWMVKLPSYVHVLAGTAWVGGIVALSVLGTTRRHLTPGAGPVWAQMWKRFSRVAQVCVAGIVVSGLWMIWGVVSSPAQLVTTTFGRILLLKLLLVATLIGLGVYNEHILLPRLAALRAAGDRHGLFVAAVRHFPRVVVTEAVIGAAVLLIVPFLNGSAREEAGAAESHATSAMFLATAALIVVLVASFAVNARVQTNAEQRASTMDAIQERPLASDHVPG